MKEFEKITLNRLYNAENLTIYHPIIGNRKSKTPEMTDEQKTHKETAEFYESAFGDCPFSFHYDNIPSRAEWIGHNAERITKIIIRKMCYAVMKRNKDKELSKTQDGGNMNYKSLHQIISSGYTEPIFYDLVQEVSIVYLTYINDLYITYATDLSTGETLDHRLIYTFWLLFPHCFRAVQKYLYAQKQEEYNGRLYVVTDVNEYSELDIIQRVDTTAYRTNVIENAEFSHILQDFINYFHNWGTENLSKKRYEKMHTVFMGMLKYPTQKAVAEYTGIPQSTVHDYYNMLLERWHEFYLMNHVYDTIKPEKPEPLKIVDFSKDSAELQELKARNRNKSETIKEHSNHHKYGNVAINNMKYHEPHIFSKDALKTIIDQFKTIARKDYCKQDYTKTQAETIARHDFGPMRIVNTSHCSGYEWQEDGEPFTPSYKGMKLIRK